MGVFAIRSIPQGTSVFFGDTGRLVWVHKAKIAKLPKEIRRLYEDFCIIKNNKFGCPKNFNQLTLAWYPNHSKNPNIRCDSHYNFFASRRIKKGEELTVNYLTYNDGLLH